GQRIDDVEDAEEIEPADQDGDRHHRPDRRKHNIAEAPPEAGAVDLRRIGERPVDVRKRREQDQEHEGRALRDLAEDDGGIDERRVDIPQGGYRMTREPAEDLVDGAIAVIEEKPP